MAFTTPTVVELEAGDRYELLEEIEHSTLHTWVRQYLYKRSRLTLGYWGLNALVLLTVILVAKRADIGLLAALPTVSMGMVLGFLGLLPIHEGIHAMAYRAVGAKRVRVQYELRRLTAFCLAPGEVVGARAFAVVALAPLVVLNLLLVGLLLLLGPGASALMASAALLMHTGACSGDVALLNYVWLHRSQELFTFDDAATPHTYFYRRRQ